MTWNKEEIDGQEWWTNEEVGNILKLPDGRYVSMMPYICKFGPFDDLEKAKNSFNREKINDFINEYNIEITAK